MILHATSFFDDKTMYYGQKCLVSCAGVAIVGPPLVPNVRGVCPNKKNAFAECLDAVFLQRQNDF